MLVEAGLGVIECCAAERRLATEDWLLSAHPSPGRARAEWQEQGLTLLPLGALFSAVRIPGRLVNAVAETADPGEVDAFLDEALRGGPVICDPHGPRYYALVPAGMPRTWRAAVDGWHTQDVDCLGRGTYLGVPRLDLVDFPERGAASYWSVPMPPSTTLCPPLSVARLIAAGAHRMTEDTEMI
ncbi:hypothetical protein [Streptomyces hirsutus]|uniref:hypothetical protein n=1 Tax=Streptomyces hirsutus TaxID=35620 RepID=UPI0036954443